MPAKSALTKAQYVAVADFRYQLRKFVRYSEDLARKAGITPLQYQLLLQVQGQPQRDWATISELAERLQSKHHGVVALVDRCVHAGLVKRAPCPDDGRQVRIHLTPNGLDILQDLVSQHRAQLLSLGATFSVPGERELGHPTQPSNHQNPQPAQSGEHASEAAELASSPCMMEEFSEYFFPDTAAKPPGSSSSKPHQPKSK